MKNQKLPLNELRIQSYITTLNAKHVLGGFSELDDSATSGEPDPTDGTTCVPPASQKCNNYSALPCFTDGYIDCNSVSPRCAGNIAP